MNLNQLPLRALSIRQLYFGSSVTYQVPIYQRNYAWGEEEISTLIQDVYDAFETQKATYYIGTLVSFYRGDNIYEVIDGQQRLTTIYIILRALDNSPTNKLTYRARKKSNDTIQSIPDFKVDDVDSGIKSGFEFAKKALMAIVQNKDLVAFAAYFLDKVSLIHYQVPKDVDLNHYFEIMNSRGEQLESHEIVKARLLEKLSDGDKAKFARIWECCSEMSVYIQHKYNDTEIFGKDLFDFRKPDFDSLPSVDNLENTLTINKLLEEKATNQGSKDSDAADTFQPIIDFPNFLLIVLKLTRAREWGMDQSDPKRINLDDKELLRAFFPKPDDCNGPTDANFVKRFGFNLLQARFYLDNCIVHHSNEEDTIENNPWKLQYWQKQDKHGYLKNLTDGDTQDTLVHLLSMLEVSFSARQRKNYLLYCLLYLFKPESWNETGLKTLEYCTFVSALAEKYLRDVYLKADNLNEANTPKPGSFDDAILSKQGLDTTPHNAHCDFVSIYGDGTIPSKGIPLFVFNYLDYKLWQKYAKDLRGEKTKKGDSDQSTFFGALGCSGFDLTIFDKFYFSRTRKSLEHYFPQANANASASEQGNAPDQAQINCFGNYAMIGSAANSAGSNWSPKTKLDHYLDPSGKIQQVSVASLKFMIMMQRCKDNDTARTPGQEWVFEDISYHQERMLHILLPETAVVKTQPEPNEI